MKTYKTERERMVSRQIEARGITDERVLKAMRSVPRHLFLPPDEQMYAYGDHPIRIGCGQTISQPYIVALMTELLNVHEEHRVLDVGTGSGYQAAILAELAKEVHSIERHAELADTAAANLKEMGFDNIHIHVGDGSLGYLPAAPYDRIVVAASAPQKPEPLLKQLADGGRLVIPIGKRFSQHLELWDREGEKFTKSVSIPVVFVPLIGEAGWGENDF